MRKIRNLVIPKNKWQRFLLLFLLLFYGYVISEKINFATADLGRHLKNGELFFKQHIIPKTNLYSYTYPDYPFVNHHWGTGVVFYLIKILFGFSGLSIFFILLSLLTFLLFFNLAWKLSRFEIAAFFSIIIIPVLGSRVEIRPEIFSYFFAGLFFWILSNYKNGKISSRWLFFLPIIEILWVNLHIYFPIGLLILVLFFSESVVDFLIQKPGTEITNIKNLGAVFFLSIFAGLINPFAVEGFLYPLRIFKDYGYRLVENQSIWFIQNLISYPPARYFKVAFVLFLISWFYKLARVIKKRQFFPFPFTNFLLSVIFSLLAWKAIRNFTIFGYFALPIASANFRKIKIQKARTNDDYFLATCLLSLLFLGIIIINPQYWSERKTKGIGLKEGVGDAAWFFQKENIKGPILNNYDIGSYLIYYLYPKYRVFVDNRPETYPAEFFKDIYIPLQENEEKWKKIDKRYKFNAIFFYRRDATPWGQNFLVKRVFDSEWAPVYVDNYSIILLRRNWSNKSTIKKYELPKDIFSVRKQ